MKYRFKIVMGIAIAAAFMGTVAIPAQDTTAPETPATEAPATVDPNSKEAKKAARRAAAIAEVKGLLQEVTAKTNELTEQLNAAEKGKQVVKALEAWATYLDGWKKKTKGLENKKGFKFLKKDQMPDELKPDMDAFMASIQTMSTALQAKVELNKDNPKFQKRMQAIFAKLKDM